MSNSLKQMIESILITEITRLYERASNPVGLSIEDVKKLEVLVKIKDVENVEDRKKSSNSPERTIDELIKLAKSKNEQE